MPRETATTLVMSDAQIRALARVLVEHCEEYAKRGLPKALIADALGIRYEDVLRLTCADDAAMHHYLADEISRRFGPEEP